MNAPGPFHSRRRRIVGCILFVSLLCASISLLPGRRSGPPSVRKAEPPAFSIRDLLDLLQWDDPIQAPVYPYSVVPGGVSSREALQAAVAADSVVARHYAGFDLHATRVIQLSAPRFAYVSYRSGDNIFWTRNKIKIPAGESLLSDGSNLARTRCGNRLSEVPKTPTTLHDPPLRVMENPVPRQQPPLIFRPEPSFNPEWTSKQGDDPVFPAAGLPPPPDGENPPPIFGPPPIPPIFVPPIGGNPSSPPTPPPISTPEPGTLALLFAGASCGVLFRGRGSNPARRPKTPSQQANAAYNTCVDERGYSVK